MFDFREKFKNRPTVELLQMLEQTEKYQPEAIAAANAIIAERKEGNPEFFLEDPSIYSKEKERPSNSHDQNNSKIKEIDIWEESETEKSVKITIRNQIIAILVAYLTINAMFLFERVYYNFNDDKPMLLTFLFAQLSFAIVGSIFFFKREKIGWVFLVFDFSFRLIFCLKLLVLSIPFLFTDTPHSIYFITFPLMLFIILLFRMSRRKLMAQFNATNQTLMLSMGASLIFAACITYALRFV